MALFIACADLELKEYNRVYCSMGLGMHRSLSLPWVFSLNDDLTC